MIIDFRGLVADSEFSPENAKMNGVTVAEGLGFRHDAGVDSLDLAEIIRALEVIHGHGSSNEARKNATIYLEQSKAHPDAPSRGIALAKDASQPPVVRHYGLSLVEYPVRYKWEELDENQSALLREWVLRLAETAQEDEPIFLRNKVAQIWVELAKRSWIDEWPNMDAKLVDLWQKTFVHRDIVLQVLETLSDEVFSKEEGLSSLHAGELGKACVEIFASTSVLAQAFPSRQPVPAIRCGNEGWVNRIAKLLESCLVPGSCTEQQALDFSIKTLVVFRSVILWMTPKTIYAANCLELFCTCIQAANSSVRVAGVEAMHALYHRPNLDDDDIVNLVLPMFTGQKVALLHQSYESSLVTIDDLDDTKYTALKKLSETMCALGNFLDQRAQLIRADHEVSQFLDLLLLVLQNPSLVVSIPVLYVWTKLLGSRTIGKSDIISRFIGSLLEICSQRLLRYEALPADSTNPTYLFLLEDIETLPERHAFIGNYRRYCMSVVELIVRKSPFEALQHILGQADHLFKSLYENDKPFRIESFASDSSALLRTDAQLTVVMTALKGYLKWLKSHPAKNEHDESQCQAMQDALQHWCESLLLANYQDPIIRKRVLQLCVEVSSTVLTSRPQFAISICKDLLSMDVTDSTDPVQYHEAVRDLLASSAKELQRLAMKFCDHVYPLYAELEAKINEIASHGILDRKTKFDYQASLFLIIQRTTALSESEKISRLQQMIRGYLEPWQSLNLQESLKSLGTFSEALCLENLPDYMLARKADQIEDWSAYVLDEEGLNMQRTILDRSEQLPLQPVKSFLSASTDKAPVGSTELMVAQSLWQEVIRTILPNLLQFVSYAHKFQNITAWSAFPEEFQTIINRTFMDRVWQAGISNESRDDFHNRVRNTKTSLEGLASTVRSAIRQVRETSYWIIHCMSQLGESFYGHQDLPEPLAQALFADAHALSAHQLSGLLKLAGALIDSCPPSLRKHFLPPILVNLFSQLNKKIIADWNNIEHHKQENTGEESLDQEMKEESILRQLTHSAVLLIQKLLILQQPEGESSSADSQSIRALVLSLPHVLEPLVIFSKNALRAHDSRSCAIVTRVLRSLIRDFRGDSATAVEVREFFCTDVLKACITSLNDPYFADMQKDLAVLIASILLYAPKTDTPRQILMSLPLDSKKVDDHLYYLCRTANERQQRSYVLSLLDGVRGVSIHEEGKIRGDAWKKRTALQEKFMKIDSDPGAKRGPSPDLGGLAEMFS